MVARDADVEHRHGDLRLRDGRHVRPRLFSVDAPLIPLHSVEEILRRRRRRPMATAKDAMLRDRPRAFAPDRSDRWIGSDFRCRRPVGVDGCDAERADRFRTRAPLRVRREDASGDSVSALKTTTRRRDPVNASGIIPGSVGDTRTSSSVATAQPAMARVVSPATIDTLRIHPPVRFVHDARS